MKIKDNVVLVTGGARGIGLALVERFVHEGNKILIFDNHPLQNENQYIFKLSSLLHEIE